LVNHSPNLIRFSPSGVSQYVSIPEVKDEEVRAITADPGGGVWLGLSRGDLALYREGKVLLVPFHRAGTNATVHQLTMTSDRAVLGATAIGVVAWRNGKAQILGRENGLPCLDIYSMAVDRQNGLWLYSACGLLSVSSSELKRWWEHSEAKLSIGVFDTLDGAFPTRPAFNPKSGVTPDGKIWFASVGLLQQIDPPLLSKNTLSPPVAIQSLIADHKGYPTSGSRLPPLARELEMDYTALSFTIPKKVLFRYKLDGWDSQWQDAGSRRQAFYTNLRPGPYHFHVIACNNDGLWNEVGATMDFTIAPAYYQTI
jgi:ligand-binding sensor domain-containing protein